MLILSTVICIDDQLVVFAAYRDQVKSSLQSPTNPQNDVLLLDYNLTGLLEYETLIGNR